LKEANMSNDSVISFHRIHACQRKTQGNHISIASRGKYGVHSAVTLLIYVLSSALGQPVNHIP